MINAREGFELNIEDNKGRKRDWKFATHAVFLLIEK